MNSLVHAIIRRIRMRIPGIVVIMEQSECSWDQNTMQGHASIVDMLILMGMVDEGQFVKPSSVGGVRDKFNCIESKEMDVFASGRSTVGHTLFCFSRDLRI